MLSLPFHGLLHLPCACRRPAAPGCRQRATAGPQLGGGLLPGSACRHSRPLAPLASSRRHLRRAAGFAAAGSDAGGGSSDGAAAAPSDRCCLTYFTTLTAGTKLIRHIGFQVVRIITVRGNSQSALADAAA